MGYLVHKWNRLVLERIGMSKKRDLCISEGRKSTGEEDANVVINLIILKQ